MHANHMTRRVDIRQPMAIRAPQKPTTKKKKKASSTTAATKTAKPQQQQQQQKATTKRPTLRDAHKALTRARILEAAAKRFSSTGYGVTTVDDVALDAGIGRATFYLHFGSLQEVMEALLEGVLPAVHALYDELAALPVVDHAALVAWLGRFFDFYAGHKGVLSASMQAETVDLQWSRRIEAVSWKFVARFAPSGPASSSSPTAARKEARQVRALILLEELDRLAYLIAVRGWKVDRGAAIDVLAEHWRAFLTMTTTTTTTTTTKA